MVKKIVQVLAEGKVIVLPTDTVYGLACDARNPMVARKIFKIKKGLFQNQSEFLLGI